MNRMDLQKKRMKKLKSVKMKMMNSIGFLAWLKGYQDGDAGCIFQTQKGYQSEYLIEFQQNYKNYSARLHQVMLEALSDLIQEADSQSKLRMEKQSRQYELMNSGIDELDQWKNQERIRHKRRVEAEQLKKEIQELNLQIAEKIQLIEEFELYKEAQRQAVLRKAEAMLTRYAQGASRFLNTAAEFHLEEKEDVRDLVTRHMEEIKRFEREDEYEIL